MTSTSPNCEGVEYGFSGNLEVFSKTAFSILLANIHICKTKTVKNWMVGTHKGKYAPMGEDLFAEMCLRENGVEEIDAFDITKDGCCHCLIFLVRKIYLKLFSNGPRVNPHIG